MFKKIGGLLMTLLGLALLVYSAARSLNFIMLTLPPDKQILAYFGLAALDGGLIAWLLAFLYGSRGWQRAISLLMVGVDLVGAVAMFTFDTLLEAGNAGLGTGLTPDEIQTAILALSGVIALNITATIGHHLTDPDKLREMAEEDAQDTIDDEEIKQIKDNAATLAAQVSPLRALAWQERQRARLLGLAGIDPVVIDGQSYDVTAIPAKPERESDKAPTWWPFGKPKKTKATPPPTADKCAQCGANAQGNNGVDWWGKEKPGEASPIRLCNNCAKAKIDGQASEAQPQAQPAPQVDPALLAAIMAAMAATGDQRSQPAQPAPNGNGHKPAPVTYQAESEGLPGPL
jgi:hypothetical protein